MRYYPVFLDLQGRPVTVIGGGRVAERKVGPLLICGAAVTVISPSLTRKLRLLVRAGAIRHRARSWRRGDLAGALLILATTHSRMANARIAQSLDPNSRLINIADDPSRCNVIAPSIVTRGDLTIAISTSGKSPALARRIRRELEQSFGSEYGRFLKILGQVRTQLKARVPSMAKRRRILERLTGSDLLSLLRRGKQDEAMRSVRKLVGLKGLKLSLR